LHKIIKKKINIEIFLKYQDEKNIYKEVYKTIKIYPWRTVIEMDNYLYDYNYTGIVSASGANNLTPNYIVWERS
jgi:hypothetical protein